MTKRIWLGVAVVTAYVTVLFQFGEYLFFFLPEARLQTAARVLIVISMGFVMWRFIPSAWSRVVHRPAGNRLLVVGFIGLIVLAPIYGGNPVGGLQFSLLVNYFVGSMLVGLAEEFVSRGVVFGLCQRANIWWAVAVSAVSFGSLHFMNLRGGADFGGVVVLVLGASCFGVLVAGMMMYSGSIWVPVLVHGLYNFPLAQYSGDGDGGGIITARFIVLFTVIGLLQIATGLALVWYSDHEPVRIKRVLLKLKLIDDRPRPSEVTK